MTTCAKSIQQAEFSRFHSGFASLLASLDSTEYVNMSTRRLSEWRFNITIHVRCCVQVHCTPHSCCTTMKGDAAVQPTRVWGKVDEAWHAQELDLNRTERILEGLEGNGGEHCHGRSGEKRAGSRDLSKACTSLFVHWRDPERHTTRSTQAKQKKLVIDRIASHRISFPQLSPVGPDMAAKISIDDP